MSPAFDRRSTAVRAGPVAIDFRSECERRLPEPARQFPEKENLSMPSKAGSNRRSFIRNAGHLCAGAIAGSAMSLAAAPPDAEGGQKFLLVGLVGSEKPNACQFPLCLGRSVKGSWK